MGERKRRGKAAEPIQFPVSDGGPDISVTDIYPTIDAAWLDFAKHPALQDVSRERRELTKHAYYVAWSEAMRTIAFRINADQDMRVFDEFGVELKRYDQELQRIAKDYADALH